jgi:predicted ester cyclase
MQVQPISSVIAAFIEQIWNQQQFDQLPFFLHPGFTDHSLPVPFPDNVQGLQQWIQATSQSFDHHTTIEQQITEGDRSVVKINMQLTHIGEWRGLAPTGKIASAKGFRLFRVHDGKIIEHWGLLDGNSIENQLNGTTHGCKTAE